MTLREMRRAGARAFFSRRWFGRAILATTALYLLQAAVTGFFLWARRSIGFSSWNDFMQAKMRALAAGLDYAVPSRACALNYTYATCFETLVTFVFTGIFTFGVSAFALRMVKDDESKGYLAGALGGFAHPLGTAWLLFRSQLQVALWSLLFLVPGVVAWYRYRAAWYLKVENPDWSAGRCLAESGRVMKGHKMRAFALDCSYWLILTGVLLLVVLAASLASFGGEFGSLYLAPLAIFCIACLMWCVFAGQTVFYLSICGEASRLPYVGAASSPHPEDRRCGGSPHPEDRRCGGSPHPEDNKKESTQR